MRHVVAIGITLSLFCFAARAEDVLDAAEKQYQTELNAARERYLAKLKTELTNLTKKGELDAALKVREKITELGGEAASKIEKTTSSAPVNPNFKFPVSIHVLVDEGCEMYVNGVKLVVVGYGKVVSTKTALKVGDVITAKLINQGGLYGFFCAITAPDDATRIAVSSSHVASWKSYTPAKPASWWLPAGASDQKEAKRVENKFHADNFNIELNGTFEGLWGQSETASYVMLVITPKMLEPLLPKR